MAMLKLRRNILWPFVGLIVLSVFSAIKSGISVVSTKYAKFLVPKIVIFLQLCFSFLNIGHVDFLVLQ